MESIQLNLLRINEHFIIDDNTPYAGIWKVCACPPKYTHNGHVPSEKTVWAHSNVHCRETDGYHEFFGEKTVIVSDEVASHYF